MVSKKTYFIVLFISSVSYLFSCSGSDDSSKITQKDNLKPENLVLTITKVGATETNPNGDGSGKITCKATATNANTYLFKFSTGSEIESQSGEVEYTFTEKGLNSYSVTVYAFSSNGASISISETIQVYVLEEAFSTLIWSDEFNTDGNPKSENWAYDIGTGCPDLCGWGNGEAQYYTNRLDNASVQNGVLTIKAKKENYEGASYTSARLKTQGKFSFTYGRVEVRAKLPEGGGTWPAIWMLGSNITSVGWPSCGEIDIMEHKGNEPGVVSSAIHTPSSYGNTQNVSSITVQNVATEFHVYAIEWTEDKIDFYIDDQLHYTYNPTTKNNDTWPFNKDQFIILNIAMGGTLGGEIDPNFSEATMEIDYIRVYQ